MSNSTTLVATNASVPVPRPSNAEEKLAYAADYIPVAWLALFDPVHVTSVKGDKSLALFSSRERALARLAERRDGLLTAFPKMLEDDLTVFTRALQKAKGQNLQVFLHDAMISWNDDARGMLEGFVETTATTDIRRWRKLFLAVDYFLGERFEDLEYSPNTIVNAFVGWVSGQPAPEPKGAPPSVRGGEDRRTPWEKNLFAITDTWPSAYRTYRPSERFAEREGLRHPKFGDGYVARVISKEKIEVVFRDRGVTLLQGAHTPSRS